MPVQPATEKETDRLRLRRDVACNGLNAARYPECWDGFRDAWSFVWEATVNAGSVTTPKPTDVAILATCFAALITKVDRLQDEIDALQSEVASLKEKL